MVYGFQSFAEMFRGIVCHVSLALLATLISAAVIAWTAKALTIPMRRVFGGGVVRIVLAVAMAGTGIVESFSKHTNGPPRIVQLPGGGRGANALPPVTPSDISNGWRVAATREGRAPSRPQDGAYTIHEPWLLRGGFKDIARIPTGGWRFPWRDGFADGLTVFSDGVIRLGLRTPYFPRPFDAPLAVVPAFNWHLFPGGVSNVFWHAATPSNTLIVAWENAPVGNDVNCLTNFQAEFFVDGRFAYRYDDREVGYAPAFPFDWDNDGLENSVDPEPLVAVADAHGTNAEWYNTVCSNVFETESWRMGVNSNAYYFVDVVAARGPAPIYFTGDRVSGLGNPVVVAHAFETNRVPLLIGINYAVTSSVPIAVSVPTNSAPSGAGACYAAVTTNGVSDCAVQWPLSFGFAAVPGGGYEVEVQPFDPGGEFSWSASGGGLNLRGGSGCSFTSVSNWIGITCGTGGNCGCNGCSVDGAYSLEGASFTLPSVWCGCSAAGYGGGTNEPPSAPSVSVSFDKSVVFYEGAYTNAPNDVVAKRSTRTTLTIAAYGGEAGGMLYVSEANIGKLVRVGGNSITFPYAAFIPPQGAVSFAIEYEAETHSDSEEDISVSAAVFQRAGGSVSNSASVTAVKVVVTPEWTIGDEFIHRHILGVCEGVWCEAYPSGVGVAWMCHGSGTVVPTGSFHRHVAPFAAENYALVVEKSGCRYSLPVQSFFPDRVEVLHDDNNPILIITNAVDCGEAGGVGLLIPLYCSPTNVSFSGIEVREQSTPAYSFTQYFASPYWEGIRDHQGTAISSDWLSPAGGNYFGTDEASIGLCPKPWLGGGNLEWRIPNECRPAIGTPVSTNVFTTVRQNFRITENGTVQVMKFGYMVERTTNGTVQAWRTNEN